METVLEGDLCVVRRSGRMYCWLAREIKADSRCPKKWEDVILKFSAKDDRTLEAHMVFYVPPQKGKQSADVEFTLSCPIPPDVWEDVEDLMEIKRMDAEISRIRENLKNKPNAYAFKPTKKAVKRRTVSIHTAISNLLDKIN